MNKKKIIYDLIIANLILIFLLMLGKFKVVHDFTEVLVVVILTPIAFGVFLFYILKPLNNNFLNKGMKKSRAATLTLIIAVFILSAIGRYFGNYLMEQVTLLKSIVLSVVEEDYIIDTAKEYIESDSIKIVLQNIFTQLLEYVQLVFSNAKEIFDKGMMLFSNILLVVLITFFLLRDGDKFRPFVIKYCPGKYKEVLGNVLSKGDDVLATYIRGQAIVALSLSTMVFVGYLIIKMPSALLLAFITFILAFIPFVGFFISMIIPYIIAVAMGLNMVIKLSVLFVIAQTLKGRVVVPFIMGRAMKIHPITDIFLVVGAAAIGGPLAAFCVVPIYSLLKLTYGELKREGFIKF